MEKEYVERLLAVLESIDRSLLSIDDGLREVSSEVRHVAEAINDLPF